MGAISAKRNLAIWRQSGSDACYHRNKSHGLTLPRLPALLFHGPSLSFIIFISSYNQCEILSKIDSSVWLLIPKLSCLGAKARAFNCLTVENCQGKRSKIPIAFAMSSFVFERTNGYCSCVVPYFNGCCFCTLFQRRSATLRRPRNKRKLQGWTEEDNWRIWGKHFRITLSYDLFSFAVSSSHVAWRVENLYELFAGTLALIPNHCLGLCIDCFLKRPWCLWQYGLKDVCWIIAKIACGKL